MFIRRPITHTIAVYRASHRTFTPSANNLGNISARCSYVNYFQVFFNFLILSTSVARSDSCNFCASPTIINIISCRSKCVRASECGFSPDDSRVQVNELHSKVKTQLSHSHTLCKCVAGVTGFLLPVDSLFVRSSSPLSPLFNRTRPTPPRFVNEHSTADRVTQHHHKILCYSPQIII